MQGMCRLSAMWLVGVLASAFDAFDNRAHFVGMFLFSSNALARFGWFNVPPVSGSSGKVVAVSTGNILAQRVSLSVPYFRITSAHA